MATKKPIYAKARPKRLGKPKSFNKKSKAYKSAKRKADKKFGKRFLCIKTSSYHKLLKNINQERKNEYKPSNTNAIRTCYSKRQHS